MDCIAVVIYETCFTSTNVYPCTRYIVSLCLTHMDCIVVVSEKEFVAKVRCKGPERRLFARLLGEERGTGHMEGEAGGKQGRRGGVATEG